jgi:hypothetical protein
MKCYTDEDTNLLRDPAAMGDLDATVVSQLTMIWSKPVPVMVPSREEDTYNSKGKSGNRNICSNPHGMKDTVTMYHMAIECVVVSIDIVTGDAFAVFAPHTDVSGQRGPFSCALCISIHLVLLELGHPFE